MECDSCPFYEETAESCGWAESTDSFLRRALSDGPGPGPADRCYIAELSWVRCPNPSHTDMSRDGDDSSLKARIGRWAARKDVHRQRRIRRWIDGMEGPSEW